MTGFVLNMTGFVLNITGLVALARGTPLTHNFLKQILEDERITLLALNF